MNIFNMAICVPFPICVGMNRSDLVTLVGYIAVPHMRGDEPAVDLATKDIDGRSPYAWG